MKSILSLPIARFISSIFLLIQCTGCSQYVTPGMAANLSGLGKVKGQGLVSEYSDQKLQKIADAKPALKLPAALVLARVQGLGYRNNNVTGVNFGGFSLVTTRDVENDEDMARLKKFRDLQEVGTISSILVQESLSSEMALREAAARLHADLLFIYTFQTTNRDEGEYPILALLTLGFAPTISYRVDTTLSGMLVDAKTGYVYGTLETTAKEEGHSTPWSSGSALNKARHKAESKAFAKLIDEAEIFWNGLIPRYQKY